MALNDHTGEQTGSRPDVSADGLRNDFRGNFQSMQNIPELAGNPLSVAGRETTESTKIDMLKEPYSNGAGPVNPLIRQGQPTVSQAAVAIGGGAQAGIPSAQLPASGQPAARTDDEMGADDIVWVNRAKRIITGTRGDPHRQVQLLQQLSVVYLKERYGRSVHADEV